jgi:hypothetical protein
MGGAGLWRGKLVKLTLDGSNMDTLVTVVVIGLALLLFFWFMDRVWTPFRARRTVRKLLSDESPRDLRALENPKYGRVETNTDCLTIRQTQGNVLELRWSEVEEVHAFKRDLFSTDLICLAFKRSGRDEYCEIHEEMAGYHDLIERLPIHLPQFNQAWFSSVAFPAFKPNHQVIWRRSGSQAPSSASPAP